MILLAFLAIAAVGAAALFASGRLGARRHGSADGQVYRPVPPDVLGEPDPRLPPVLLPDNPAAADIADLRFSVALRGYRMDEVDEVLEKLAAALLERDAALAQLRSGQPARPGPGTQAGAPGEGGTGRQEP